MNLVAMNLGVRIDLSLGAYLHIPEERENTPEKEKVVMRAAGGIDLGADLLKAKGQSTCRAAVLGQGLDHTQGLQRKTKEEDLHQWIHHQIHIKNTVKEMKIH